MLTTAFVLGLAGSLHCVGMCSPLVLAVTSKEGLLTRVLYNGGRILMYCFLGALVSSVGFLLPTIAQYAISILLGISLLIMGITGSNFKTPAFSVIFKFTTSLKALFSKMLQKKSKFSVFVMGVLNGLLPCGLTFLALTSCITVDGPIGGFVLMAAFGLGTIPVMLGVTSGIPLLTSKFKFNMSRLTVGMQIVAGCLLIVRVFLVDNNAHTVIQGVDSITICP